MTNLFSAVVLDQNRVSATIELDAYESFSIQSVITGATAAGTLAVQVSNDNVNWSEADIVTIAGAVNWAWVAARTFDFQYLRMVFTRTGGTGAITAAIRGKTMRGGNRRVLGVI